MSTNPNLPTPDECFISVLLDEWIKDSHCLDSKKDWDADPKRPFSYKEIKAFLKSQGMAKIKDLGKPMVKAAIYRVAEIHLAAGPDASISINMGMPIGLEDGTALPRCDSHLQCVGFDASEIRTISRCMALFIDVNKGLWPFGLDALGQSEDDRSN